MGHLFYETQDDAVPPAAGVSAVVEPARQAPPSEGPADLAQARHCFSARQAQMRQILERVEATLRREIAAAEARVESWKSSLAAAQRDRELSFGGMSCNTRATDMSEHTQAHRFVAAGAD